MTTTDQHDVTASEALTVAQRALAKCVELDHALDDVHDLEADVRQLESVVAELEGVLTGWGTLAGFLLVAVAGFALPQYYFAAIRDDHLRQLRLRSVPVVLLVFGAGVSGIASRRELFGIWSVIALSVVVLLAYEYRAGVLAAVREGR